MELIWSSHGAPRPLESRYLRQRLQAAQLAMPPRSRYVHQDNIESRGVATPGSFTFLCSYRALTMMTSVPPQVQGGEYKDNHIASIAQAEVAVRDPVEGLRPRKAGIEPHRQERRPEEQTFKRVVSVHEKLAPCRNDLPNLSRVSGKSFD